MGGRAPTHEVGPHSGGSPSRPGRTLPVWEVHHRKQTGRPEATKEKLPPTTRLQLTYDEAGPRFIGPKCNPYWLSKARDAREIAERQAAKDARAARLQAIREHPSFAECG